MHMTAYARLEQFRIDIEKLLAEKAQNKTEPEGTEDSHTAGVAAHANPPGSSMQDAAGNVAAKNLFQAVDDALAVLN
jgi:hypothetical protein